MKKELVESDKLAKPVGPYSPGIKAGNFVFTAGQIGVDPATGQLKEGIKAQTEQCLNNISLILEAAGSSLDHVVKTTVFITDMSEFRAMNEIYSKFFSTDPKPARSTVQASLISPEMKVEIDAIAIIP